MLSIMFIALHFHVNGCVKIFCQKNDEVLWSIIRQWVHFCRLGAPASRLTQYLRRDPELVFLYPET